MSADDIVTVLLAVGVLAMMLTICGVIIWAIWDAGR